MITKSINLQVNINLSISAVWSLYLSFVSCVFSFVVCDLIFLLHFFICQRLLVGKSSSEDNEKAMINRLKAECGKSKQNTHFYSYHQKNMNFALSSLSHFQTFISYSLAHIVSCCCSPRRCLIYNQVGGYVQRYGSITRCSTWICWTSHQNYS